MGTALYDDGLLMLDEDGLTIRHYYFPLGTSKRLPYSAIRGIEVRRLGLLTGRGRIWGTGSLSHWFPLDCRRPQKSVVVVIHTDGSVKPCVTPVDPQRFVGVLRDRGSAARFTQN